MEGTQPSLSDQGSSQGIAHLKSNNSCYKFTRELTSGPEPSSNPPMDVG